MSGAIEPTVTDTVTGTTYYGDSAQAVVSGVRPFSLPGALPISGTHAITATGGTAANYADAVDVDGTLAVSKAAALTERAGGRLNVSEASDPNLAYSVNSTTYYCHSPQAVASGVGLWTTAGDGRREDEDVRRH